MAKQTKKPAKKVSEEPKTRTFTVSVSTGIVGSRRTETFEIEADASEEEIEDLARETMFNIIEWHYRESTDGDE